MQSKSILLKEFVRCLYLSALLIEVWGNLLALLQIIGHQPQLFGPVVP